VMSALLKELRRIDLLQDDQIGHPPR